METHLFRIAQEALTNVARHAGATLVKLELHQSGDRVRLVVEDNGRGLGEGGAGLPARPSLGMIGMRARAQEIQGELRLSRPPRGGLRIEVEAPLPPPREEQVAKEDTHPVGR